MKYGALVLMPDNLPTWAATPCGCGLHTCEKLLWPRGLAVKNLRGQTVSVVCALMLGADYSDLDRDHKVMLYEERLARAFVKRTQGVAETDDVKPETKKKPPVKRKKETKPRKKSTSLAGDILSDADGSMDRGQALSEGVKEGG